MIDKDGNKIVSKTESQDPSFLLNEISFLMKAFYKDKNDSRALIIAKKIVSFLKQKDDPAIIEHLKILEDFSSSSKSDDFLWLLVYSRRELANKQSTFFRSGKRSALQHRKIAAKHFREIVRVSPSIHNRSAEIFEIVNLVNRHKEIMTSSEIRDLLGTAEQLFKDIELSKEEIYFEAGEFLYQTATTADDILMNDDNTKLHNLMQMIFFAEKLYNHHQHIDSLKLAAIGYQLCLNYDIFCFDEEKEKICAIISALETECNNGKTELKSTLQSLKKKFSTHK